METLLLFLSIFALLDLLALELKSPLAPTSSPAAGPLSPPPRRKEAGSPRRIRRALARSRLRSRSPVSSSGPSSSPAFLPPSAAPFATSAAVLSWPAWRRNLDRKPLFLDEADEANNGRMYRNFDPILGWRWLAYPKGTYEARSQQLRADRESNMPAGQVELSTQPPANVPAPPLPTIRAPSPDTSAPLANEAAASIPPPPPGNSWAGPTSTPPPPPPPTGLELQAAPPVKYPSFSEQFAGLCAATQHLPLPWPRLSFAEQFALSCRGTQHLPLPFPLPPPSILPPPSPMVQAQAPASSTSPPPTIDFGFSAGPSSRPTSRGPLRRLPPAVRARNADEATYRANRQRQNLMNFYGLV